MKRFGVMLIAGLCLFILSGCLCRHDWTEANCTTEKTCSLCGKIEGEPLGHSWVEATCEFPKTCSVCSATEGQPLAHSEAERYSSVDYVTLSAERQVYCSDCGQTLSAEEVVLDALHDETCFYFDSRSFLERYTAVAEILQFESCDFIEIEEETTKDVLTLEYNGSRFGRTKVKGGEDYRVRVRFTFYGLDESGGEDALPRCTRIAVTLASSTTVGDPFSDAPAPVTEEEEAILNEERSKVNSVMLNAMILRNVCVTLMTCDPTLEAVLPRDASADLLLGLMDPGEDDTIVHNNAVHNNIRYYINEDRELVIEVAS